MLVYDMQALVIHFFPPAGTEDRARRVVTISELIGMINKAQQKTGPKWRRYYHKHREKEIARQRAYRATHQEEVREYNRQYYQARKKRKAAQPGQAVLIQEAVTCST